MMFAWNYRSHRLRRYFSKSAVARLITAGLFLLLILGLAYDVYALFLRQFSLLSASGYFKLSLSLFIWEVLFLVIFGLAYGSAFIGGIFAVFRTGSDDWIMSTPKYKLVIERAWFRLFGSSLWPLIVIGLPTVLAARTAFSLSYAAVIPPLIAMIFLVALAVTTAMLTFLIPAAILYLLSKVAHKRMVRLGYVVSIGVLFIILAATGVRYRLGGQNLERTFSVLDQSSSSADPSIVADVFKLFPSHPVAMSIFLSETPEGSSAGAPLLEIALMTAAAMAILLLFASLYLPLWQLLQEGHNNAAVKAVDGRKARIHSKPKPFPRFFKSPSGAMFEKELLLTFRSMRNVLWFGFLLALWLVQAGLEFLLRFSSIYHSVDLGQIMTWLQTLQLATTVYFMCAFVLRFAFPAFSVERKTIWLIGTAPLDLGKVFLSKEAFYVSLFACLGLLSSLANFMILSLPLTAGIAFMILMLIATAFITTWGLSLGALFPNFDTDDPELLSTSLPGLAFIGSSLAYGALGIFLFYKFLNGSGLSIVMLFEAASLIMIMLLIVTARRHVRKMEFVKEIS